ncbi:MAG: hypothetical protein V1783_03485 [Bacteroidota bacterium]
MPKETFNIFYTWQSDINQKANHYFIKDCINKALSELKKENNITLVPRLDSDTKGMIGSQNISDYILNKIDASQVFIADITIINSNPEDKIPNKRLTPNPNVLFELGYAVNRLSWNRIICLNNEAFSTIKQMPFDIQQNRISQYNYNGKENKDDAQVSLVILLKKAIKDIIKNHDFLIEKEHQQNIFQHDIKIFQGFNTILKNTNFIDFFEHISSCQTVLSNEYVLMDKLYFYLTNDDNQFLVSEINIDSLELASAINKAHRTLGNTLFANQIPNSISGISDQKHQIVCSLPSDIARFKTFEEFEIKRDNSINRNNKAILNAISKYKIFRLTVKKQLFI